MEDQRTPPKSAGECEKSAVPRRRAETTEPTPVVAVGVETLPGKTEAVPGAAWVAEMVAAVVASSVAVADPWTHDSA